jgi:TPP-dependent pyruvate/acetoin dehydrogenase alpha subunit
MPTRLKARSAPAAVAGKNGHSLISSSKFRQLYAAMLKYELLEERLGRSAPAVGTTHAPTAGAVGVMLDLEREDTVVLTSRMFPASHVKGVPARDLLPCNGTRTNGTAVAHSAVNALVPPSSSISAPAGLATGAALANKIAKNRKIAVAFLEGDRRCLEESREAFEIASANKLPVLYVIQTRPDRAGEELLSKIAELFPVITVDAHDVVAVYRVAQESIARARDGGPALIVCIPCDQNAANAVTNMERYLAAKQLFCDEWKSEITAEFTTEMDAACLPLPDPLA